ncbi:hypothetical protein DSO57_1016886 [Entomophthora muscae]|uniref:Uncharacterized protein n=1 Tax=Entomophthora muscae TaxID=34485 RepID=A0ACC2SHG4_9FUNG|nr:hypothetical protein DSO57_1016886 [Entomophthora muscae]
MGTRTRDLSHLDEIISLYHPDIPRPKPRPRRPPSPNPNEPTFLPRRKFGFYICCHKVYTTHNTALNHWLDNHFLPFKGTTNIVTSHGTLPKFYLPPNPCKSHKDLSKKSIPLVARTQYYLSQINHVPVTPSRFRPAPHTKPPHEFKDPYSAVQAMAYDFIGTIISNTKEYQTFLEVILNKDKVNHINNLKEHIIYFPFWADYCYPGLPKVIAVMPQEKKPHNLPSCSKHNNTYYISSMGELEKIYPKNKIVKCRLVNGEITVVSVEDKDNPSLDTVGCPFFPCCSSFSSLSDLKYHLLRNHLNKDHFNYGKRDPISCYTCPIYSCNIRFSLSDELRYHMLENHI